MYVRVQFYKSLGNFNFMLEFDTLPPAHIICMSGIYT